jgi:hypothetical protein
VEGGQGFPDPHCKSSGFLVAGPPFPFHRPRNDLLLLFLNCYYYYYYELTTLVLGCYGSWHALKEGNVTYVLVLQNLGSRYVQVQQQQQQLNDL